MNRSKSPKFNSIDLFSGCGGLTEGLRMAGFNTKVAIEIDSDAVSAFKLNHRKTHVIQKDIREISIAEIKRKLNGAPLHLLAGCPPCQGFSSMRKLNKRRSATDQRNNLVLEYFRMVKGLKPLTIMMENVPGLQDYYLFKHIVNELKDLGYHPSVEVVNVKYYGVPQSRRRLVLVGSLLGKISVAQATGETLTVKDAIGAMESIEETTDPIHKIIPNHSPKVLERIKLVPKNGGSRNDLPEEFKLKCHQDEEIGFNDVYGRLSWDSCATTITGGCLNPSKGRFLHPVQDRCISGREAALLQSFPRDYKFPANIAKMSLALLIGNALPPKFSYYQSLNIKEHLNLFLG